MSDRAKKRHNEDTLGGVAKRARTLNYGYTPTTHETRDAWEQLLKIISVILSDEEQSALLEIAEEILKLLKDDSRRDIDKKPLVEEVLDIQVTDDYFRNLLRLANKLKDYVIEDQEADEDADQQDVTMAIDPEEFEGDGDEDQDNMDEDEDDEGEGEALCNKMDEEEEHLDKDHLDARTIDAEWVQREVPKLSPEEEAQETQQRAEQIFNLLCDFESTNKTRLETAMLKLFKYDQQKSHGFITKCLNNREKIVYCVRMARAKGAEKDSIQEELRKQTFGPAILAELEKEDFDNEKDLQYRQRLRQQKKEQQDLQEATNLDNKLAIQNFEDLSHQDGARTMPKKKFVFPTGSKTINLKGYDEHHIPPYKRKEHREEDKLDISKMPSWAHSAFKDIKALNPVQSRCYNCAFERGDNMLLCAPTGAGKTNVAMLTIMHEISKCVDETTRELDKDKLEKVKVVYIAPMKALVQEVVETFSNRLKDYNLIVRELTGDSGMTQKQINECNMIVTTPEKWDIVTRKTGEKTNLAHVSLMIIDEIHLLHDTRGPVLEAIVARTIRNMEAVQEFTRLVGLSATLPNYEDVATFLRVEKSTDPDKNGLLHFDGTYRPIPLEQQYISINEKKQLKRRGLMNDIVYEKVMKVAGDLQQQCMIFVHSRKDTVATAKSICDRALEKETLGKLLSKKDELRGEAETVKDTHLRALIPYGFAVHHAGLCREDRAVVERLFRDRHIQVLVSTATLAWGVNLPAYCVIIKGTQIYNPEKGRWTELSSLDVMQMIGRAGRLDKAQNIADQKGLGIIITDASEVKFYLSLLNQQLPIESHFISRLTDQLNAEIVMGTVQDREEACKWLSYTYLYIRMLRNPELYKVERSELTSDPTLVKRRTALVHKAASDLEKAGLIRYDRKTGVFASTELGRVCSYYYLTTGTVLKFHKHMSPTMSEIDIFRLFAMADEFKYMGVRQEEKMELKRLLDNVPIPIKEDSDNPLAKVNVLLQTYISQTKLEGYSIMSDMVYIKQSANRVLRAMLEIALTYRWAELSEKLLNLAKMVEHRVWLSQSPLRQLRKVPLQLIQSLERKNINWDVFFDYSTNELSQIVGTTNAQPVKRVCNMIPRVVVEPGDISFMPLTRSLLAVHISITPDFKYDEKLHGAGETFHVLVQDPDGERILHHETLFIKEQNCKEEHHLGFYVDIFDPMPPHYFVKVISDKWLWSETCIPLNLSDVVLPEKVPPHTELLDTTPAPISIIGCKEFEDLYTDIIEELNPIQTQVAPALLNSDDNVLICAPGGSGKTLCGELALLRHLAMTQGTPSRAVYLAPRQEMVDNVYMDWKVKFGQKLGKKVVKLTGESVTDLDLLKENEIILATAQQWDMISRKWTKRANVKKVRLYIADELHHLDTPQGPTMEIVLSRVRYIGSQKDCNNRIVGLSYSLLHAREVGSWLGASSANIFNFHPTARPISLEFRYRTFDQPGYTARTNAMLKPTFLAIKQYASNRPVVVFTPSKRIADQLCVELVTQCRNEGDGNQRRFLHEKVETIANYTQKVTSSLLKQSLQYGVGVLKRGMHPHDEKVTTKLFEAGFVQVLLCPYELAYKLTVRPYMVVIAGTQFYDGKQCVHSDYRFPDMFEMLSKAGRPGKDNDAMVYVMCHSPKKEALEKIVTRMPGWPVESKLNYSFHDHLNAEVDANTISDPQVAVDYLSHTFLYKRLRQNPNYYNMTGTSQNHMSDFLSSLIESSAEALINASCITAEEDDDAEMPTFEITNMGRIASHYYLSSETIEVFSSNINSSTTLRKVIETVSTASEFNTLIIRHKEENKLRSLAKHCSIQQKDLRFDQASTKASLLLHAHFSRIAIDDDLHEDLRELLPSALPLISAMVDIIYTNRWLQPLFDCMTLSQMIIQGMWNTDSLLLQLPHVSKSLATRWSEKFGVTSGDDVLDLEDDQRDELLQGMSKQQQSDIATACNRLPDISVNFEVSNPDDIHQDGLVEVIVTLERELEEDGTIAPVYAPFYPQQKKEMWWVFIGEESENTVHALRRETLTKESQQVKMKFAAPAKGTHELSLYVKCDSYLGADFKQQFKLNVLEPEESDSESSES